MKQYKRIIVFGDGWGAVAVMKGLRNFGLPVYVVSNDEDVLQLAERTAAADLSVYDNEMLLFAGYKPIVPNSVLEKNCCINIHYSLLPQYRGMHSTVWAILNDEPVLGGTIHLMNQYIDDGDILYQFCVANDRTSTSRQYMETFNHLVEETIADVLMRFIQGNLVPQKQDKSKASWVGKRNEKDCMIDFAKPIAYQKAFFRALVEPYPLPYVTYKGNKYVVTQANYHPSSVITHIGRILNIDNDGLWVKCADGYVVLKELRDVEKNIVSFENFRIGQYLNT
jgi:methionyl-tRNA formyltransferase